jgi:hypothetical protein
LLILDKPFAAPPLNAENPKAMKIGIIGQALNDALRGGAASSVLAFEVKPASVEAQETAPGAGAAK